MTVKLYTLSYNIYDGAGRGKRAIDAVLADPAAKERDRKAMLERRARAVPFVPAPLVFFGYIFNFSTVLAGPAFEVRASCLCLLLGGSERASDLPPFRRSPSTSAPRAARRSPRRRTASSPRSRRWAWAPAAWSPAS